MPADDLYLRLAVALFAGLLIGAERGWKQRDEPEGGRPAGLRTFGLIGFGGGLWALVAGELGALVLAAAVLVVGATVASVYWLQVRERQHYGMTTEVAAFVTFALGATAVAGHPTVAAAGAVVTALLLGFKPPLHGWLQRISERELYGALQLLLVSVVILPVLPNQGYGPWDALNPYTLWWMVVLIAAIGFVGYIAVRVAGTRYGLLLTGFAGGLMASTPLALAFGRLGRKSPDNAAVLAAAILAASSTMFPRALVVASVIEPRLFSSLLVPLLVMMVIGYLAAAFWWFTAPPTKKEAEPPIRNPFELAPALRFGVLLALVMLLAHALERWAGDTGLYALALVSGLTDVDAITLSLANLAGDEGRLGVAAGGIALAAMSNTVFKAGLVVAVGGRALGMRMAVSAAFILAGGALALFVQSVVGSA